MEATQLVKGVLDLAVLAVVAESDGYGYDVVRRLRTAGLMPLGVALTRASSQHTSYYGYDGYYGYGTGGAASTARESAPARLDRSPA